MSESPEVLTGIVKWFNTRSGYGFITVVDADHELRGTDIFVHYTSLTTSTPQYRYLVQGEYVTFSMASLDNAAHKHHAINISGIENGPIMCETHATNALKPVLPVTPPQPKAKRLLGLRKVAPPALEVPAPEVPPGFTQIVKKPQRPLLQRS